MEWLWLFVGLIVGTSLAAVVMLLRSQKTERSLRDQLANVSATLRATEAARDEDKSELRDVFASISGDALAKNNEAFLQLAAERLGAVATAADGTLEQRKTEIQALLAPLNEVLKSYQSRLGDIEKSRTESYGALQLQIGAMKDAQKELHTQTGHLVSALRKSSTRGRWGEIALRRLVELAGLTDHCDFVEQSSVDSEEGKLRPDMVVRLPGNRTVIIDSKAVIKAFLDANECADEAGRKQCMVLHAKYVRERANELSKKAYWNQFEHSPEYVVLFLPGEAFLYAAVENDGDLIEDCMKNRVIISTPTTLIALLKAIEFGWRQSAIADNAEEIRKLGSELYERIATWANHLTKVGASLENAVESYNSAIGSLETRVLVTAKKIGALGARKDREIESIEPVDLRTRALSSS